MRNSYDVFLVLNNFRACASQHRMSLSPLSATVEGHLIGAEGYLDADADKGLIALRFSSGSVDALGEGGILAMVVESGLPMIVPGALEPDARRTFYMRHLSHYGVYLQQYPGDDEAYGLLERTLMGLAAHIAEDILAEGFSSTVDLPLDDDHQIDFDSMLSWSQGGTLDVDEQDILSELPVIIDLPLRRRRAETAL